MTPTTPAALAWEIARQRHSWTIVVVPDGADRALASLIASELQSVLEMEEEPGTCHVLRASADVADAVRGLPSQDAAVIYGLDALDELALSRLDRLRNRMIPGPCLVFAVSAGALSRVHGHLPNVWGVVGTEVWSLQSPDAPLDTSTRLFPRARPSAQRVGRGRH